MSQIPPGASDGWLDPYGNHQPGVPPAGYWQANDGRWYPPSPPSAAETQIAPTTTPQPTTPQPAAPPPTAPQPGAAPGFPPPQPASAQPGSPPGFPPPQPGSPQPGSPASFTPPQPASAQPGSPPGFAPPQPGSPQPGSSASFQPPQPGAPFAAGAPPGQFAPPSAPPSEPPSPFGTPPPSEPPSPFGTPPSGPGATLSPPPNFAPPPSQPPKSRTGLYVTLGIIAVLFAGCTTAGFIALNRAADGVDNAIDELTSTTADVGGTEETAATTAPPSDTGSTTTESRSLAGVTTSSPQGAGTGDAVGCTYVDDETIVLEVVNSGSAIQSYFLTVAFFDGEQRLGDTIAFVNNLRPGERTIESSLIFEQEGSRCEVIEADSFPTDSDPDHVADVSPCTITGVDALGDITGELSATNSSSITSDYSIQVAFVDPDGIRRGTGFANVESVRPGETAPSPVFSFVEERPDLVCEVVGVARIDS